MSKLQTEVRYRPWIGPSGGVLRMAGENYTNQYQYAIALKNYGEVPSHEVTALSLVSSSMPTREFFKNESVIKFNLGPLLPNMEKKYWIFIDAVMIKRLLMGVPIFCCPIFLLYLCRRYERIRHNKSI